MPFIPLQGLTTQMVLPEYSSGTGLLTLLHREQETEEWDMGETIGWDIGHCHDSSFYLGRGRWEFTGDKYVIS